MHLLPMVQTPNGIAIGKMYTSQQNLPLPLVATGMWLLQLLQGSQTLLLLGQVVATGTGGTTGTTGGIGVTPQLGGTIGKRGRLLQIPMEVWLPQMYHI